MVAPVAESGIAATHGVPPVPAPPPAPPTATSPPVPPVATPPPLPDTFSPPLAALPALAPPSAVPLPPTTVAEPATAAPPAPPVALSFGASLELQPASVSHRPSAQPHDTAPSAVRSMKISNHK